MMARSVPALAAALLLVATDIAVAAEAAPQFAGMAPADALSEDESRKLRERLQRESFTLTGEIRRKGPLLITVGLKSGQPWRLVIDPASGEIIGRRSLSDPTHPSP